MPRAIVNESNVFRFRPPQPRKQRRIAGPDGGRATEVVPLDGYWDRLVKMVPAEVLAAYLAAQGIIESAAAPPPASWAVFAIFLVATPLSLRAQEVRAPAHLVISTVAYTVWVAAIGGPFALTAWYEPYMGSLAVIVVTFALARANPQEGRA